MKKNKKRSHCPVSCSLDIFGDKWSLLIIRDIMFRGKFSYGEFMTSEEKIASNILADRLCLLESEGIISKKVSPENKSKFIYRLTEKGIDLLPVMLAITEWGTKYHPETPPFPREILKQFSQDKEKRIKKYAEKLKAQIG